MATYSLNYQQETVNIQNTINEAVLEAIAVLAADPSVQIVRIEASTNPDYVLTVQRS